MAIGQVSYKASDRLQVGSRASRVRTTDLKEFGFRIEASDQVGGGARFAVTPSVHLVADGSLVAYRRRGEPVTERDGSVLVGASVLLARGWDASTPAAVVLDATHPGAQLWSGTLGTLGQSQVGDAGAAGILVVGEVVTLAQALTFAAPVAVAASSSN